MNRRSFAALLLIAGSTANTSCLFRKRTKTEPPVITAPPSTRTPPVETPNVPPPPNIDTPKSAETLPAPTIETPIPSKPPRVKPPPTRRTRRTTPRPAPASQPAGEPTEVDSTPPVPALTQLLTPAEKQAYNQAIDAALKSARTKLNSLQSRRLNSTQRASLERASTIAKQAEESRSTDLTTAKALAERADVLAEDLIRGSQ